MNWFMDTKTVRTIISIKRLSIHVLHGIEALDSLSLTDLSIAPLWPIDLLSEGDGGES